MCRIIVMTCLFAAISGCHRINPTIATLPLAIKGPQPGCDVPPNQMLPNPLHVTANDQEFFWNQLVDTVDDYFRIVSERRAEFSAGLPTEGLIETDYLPGATVLEPWRWDSASDYELAFATLQSIRRRARVQVVPTGAGYGVNVEVFQELEDVDRPAQGVPGSWTPRYDGAFVRNRGQRITEGPLSARSLGWIPVGRNVALEQEILRQLHGRLYESPAPVAY